ncbi:hypothetical protein DSO57_1001836 [Entomophthora muscae]|uniref:Uncharacterized protein n=1 Tax=Entomophthora muscae TaxID=34485 RepID=A0ACC2SY40_9FUNG|nr:hypothetical protein DSO57_1001836 [Entomophthora muscae]
MSMECKQTVPKVHHIVEEEYDSEGDQEDEKASQDKEPKKLLSSQDKEKSLVAHLYVPPPSPPSPLLYEDPGAPNCVPPPNTALILETADPKVPTLASPSLGSMDPELVPCSAILTPRR